MRLYIAGASKEAERVRAAMNAAQAAGFELTLDWLAEIDAAGGVTNEGLANWERSQYANADLDAIANAELFWLLVPSAGVGAWVELGYALHRGMPIVISGPASARSIFCALGREVATDEEGLHALQDIHAARMRAFEALL